MCAEAQDVHAENAANGILAAQFLVRIATGVLAIAELKKPCES